jgi:NTE family protein
MLQDHADAPFRWIPTDEGEAGPQPAVALCLSGGGFRAMLFHLGAVWRLNELGWLPKLARVSSVSGGSILAGVLGWRWEALKFDAAGTAAEFQRQIVDPIRTLAGRTIDATAIITGAMGIGSIADKLVDAYRRFLFGDATLRDLPDAPRFVINATNVQTGVLWRFSKPFMADYRVGVVPRPTVPLAVAVAASSAFPPFLSPLELDLDPTHFTPRSGYDLQTSPYTDVAVLTDGGVYDNLGLETAWKRCRTILVSDGGGAMASDPDPKRDWARHTFRVLLLIDNQVRSLRKRQLIAAFKNPDDEHDGAYWGIRTHIKDYRLSDALPCPESRVLEIAETPTRLKRLDAHRQERIINWGYAVCDAAIRRHVQRDAPKPLGFPYPAVGV